MRSTLYFGYRHAASQPFSTALLHPLHFGAHFIVANECICSRSGISLHSDGFAVRRCNSNGLAVLSTALGRRPGSRKPVLLIFRSRNTSRGRTKLLRADKHRGRL